MFDVLIHLSEAFAAGNSHQRQLTSRMGPRMVSIQACKALCMWRLHRKRCLQLGMKVMHLRDRPL